MNLNIGSGPVDLTSSGCWMIVNWGLSKKPDDLLRAGATFVLSCGTQDAQFCRSQLVVILEDSPELSHTWLLRSVVNLHQICFQVLSSHGDLHL